MTCLSVSPCWFALRRTYQNRKRPEKKGREPSGTEAWEERTQEIVLLENDAEKETIMFINCNYPSMQVLNVIPRACAGAFFHSSCPFFRRPCWTWRRRPLLWLPPAWRGTTGWNVSRSAWNRRGRSVSSLRTSSRRLQWITVIRKLPPSACLFWTEAVWSQSCWIAWKWDVTVRVWHEPWAQIANPKIKHGLLKSQRGGTRTYSSERNRPQIEDFNLPNPSSFCLFLVFLEGFEGGRLCKREHVFFRITYSLTQQPVKTVWRRQLADSRTHVKCVFVCAWRCQWVCGCSLIIFYSSVSLCYYEWKRQNTCLWVWTGWHVVWCFSFIFLPLFFSPRSTYNSIRHPNMSLLHRTL